MKDAAKLTKPLYETNLATELLFLVMSRSSGYDIRLGGCKVNQSRTLLVLSPIWSCCEDTFIQCPHNLIITPSMRFCHYTNVTLQIVVMFA